MILNKEFQKRAPVILPEGIYFRPELEFLGFQNFRMEGGVPMMDAPRKWAISKFGATDTSVRLYHPKGRLMCIFSESSVTYSPEIQGVLADHGFVRFENHKSRDMTCDGA